MAGVAGTLLGFVITSVSLLTAVMNRTLIENMRKTGHFQRLTREAFATCIVLLATTVVNIGALFADTDGMRIAVDVGIFLGVLALLFAVEAARRFAVVIESL
jgi:hypothetical protein